MSRICVKNLPKYITEDRLKEFFSQKGEVTDAKLMRTADGKSRQFAFVGYRTGEEAQEAIRYFNKSFLDTARIICEVAWKVGEQNIPRPWSRYSKEKEENNTDKSNRISSVTAKTDKKSKTDKKIKAEKKNTDQTINSDDPKLQEFLQVMQPRSKSKLWADDQVTPTLNQVGGEEFSQPTIGDKEITNKKLRAKKNAQKEVNSPEETQEKPPNMPHAEAVSEMDYFKSRVKKEWSDSESETDDNDEYGTGLEQDDGDSDDDDDEDRDYNDSEDRNVDSRDGCHRSDVLEQQTVRPIEGASEDYDGEVLNSGDLSSDPQDMSEVLETSRLFVRNLPYTATEDELEELFREFGNILEVHLVIDKETKRSKGFAYVRYRAVEDAARALEELDHSIFQGRLLHVMPAKDKDPSHKHEAALSDSNPKTFKQKREEERKAKESDGNTRAWNSLFMRTDTVIEYIARKYKVNKSDILDREADDLAARIALGETQVIAETKKALTNAGVNVTSLEEFASGKTEGVKRSNHVILVKNLPYSLTEGELSKMFGKFGSLDKVILPPTRTLAVVIFLEPAEARAAFRGLHYKRCIDAPLYLEWAPSNILNQDMAPWGDTTSDMIIGEQDARKVILEQQIEGILEAEIDPDRVESRSLFVKNLNFKTTEESLRKHFSENMKEGKILSVKINKHLKKGKNVSMGFGFMEFDSVETAGHVCRDLQATVLDGHALILQICHAKKEEGVSKKTEKDKSSTKLIVRNVAFEATEKDLRQLFSPFGQVKSLRLPMGVGKHRGFAFVEFVTKQEAQNALKALSSTHLYGRHLVLERAKEGETLEELRKRTAAQFTNDEDGFQNPSIIKKRKVAAF